VQNNVPHEIVPKNYLLAINEQLKRYRKWVQELRNKKIIAKYNLVRKGIYELLYPGWLEGESINFEKNVINLSPSYTDAAKARILSELNELIGGAGKESLLKNFTAATTKIRQIRAAFGDDPNKVMKKLEGGWLKGKERPATNVLAEVKIHEIITIEKAKSIASQLIGTIDKLDNILQYKSTA